MNKAFIGIVLLTSFFVSAAEVGTIYGPTTPAETVWSIAKKVYPDSKLPLTETTEALYQANPQAFMGKNINRLMKGMYLTVPTSEAISSQPKVSVSVPVPTPTPVPTPVSVTVQTEASPAVIQPVETTPTTTPVLATEEATIEPTPTTTTSIIEPETLVAPVAPVASIEFKPFEWIVISLLTLLSFLIGWMAFSMSRANRYVTVPEKDLSFKKILAESTIASAKSESNFLENLDSTDDISTKLDLARAYIEMREHEPAKRILQQALKQGNPYEQQEAHKLLTLINTVQ